MRMIHCDCDYYYDGDFWDECPDCGAEVPADDADNGDDEN